MQDNQQNPIARYGYDPFDRRIWKEAYRNKDGAPLAQAQRSYYLYAEEGLIAESQQSIVPPLPQGEGTSQNITTSAPPAIANQYGPKPGNPYTTGILLSKPRTATTKASMPITTTTT